MQTFIFKTYSKGVYHFIKYKLYTLLCMSFTAVIKLALSWFVPLNAVNKGLGFFFFFALVLHVSFLSRTDKMLKH